MDSQAWARYIGAQEWTWCHIKHSNSSKQPYSWNFQDAFSQLKGGILHTCVLLKKALKSNGF
jgi:hypothetical protein